MRAPLSVLAQVLLLVWGNTSVLVDCFDLNPGCQLASLRYKDHLCQLNMGFRGDLPDWLRQQDMAAEVLGVAFTELERFAVEQVCPCSALSLTEQCPDNIRQAMLRLTAACPLPARNITFVV